MSKPKQDTYDRAIQDLAAKIGQKGADPNLRHTLTKHVQERAAEISEFIISRAHDKATSAGR